MLPVAFGGCFALLCIVPSRSADRVDLERLRREVRCDFYQPPSAEELQLAEKLFDLLFAGERSGEKLRELLESTGLELVAIEVGGEDLHLLREAKARREGRGVFAFRQSPRERVVLQAPHADDDLYTGTIAGALFLESKAAAVGWNTASRHAVIQPGEPTADLAHQKTSLLQSFTRAFARAFPGGSCVQLHGFDAGDRRSTVATGADIILSSGTEQPPAKLAVAVERLRALGTVLLYPRDCRELGGTTNAQGVLLRTMGEQGFLHVEMAFNLRRKLKGERSARAALWEGLASTIWRREGSP